jgi:hypothetical protein
LFGVPFEKVDDMVAASRASVVTPPPVMVAPLGPAPRTDTAKTEEVAPLMAGPVPLGSKTKEMALLGRPVSSVTKTKEMVPLAAGPEPIPSAPAPVAPPPAAVAGPAPAVAGPAPANPYPPAPSRLEVVPFPPAATPEPMPALAATTADAQPAALAVSAEVPALAPATPGPLARRLPPIMFASAGVLAAAAIGFFAYRLSTSSSDPGPIPVRTVVPTAALTYRWFDATGTVKAGGERTLTFTTGGRVLKVLSPGTVFHPGDVIAEVEGAPQFKGALEHNKQRLAYYEQRLEQMTKENNRPEMRQAELKIAEKKRLIAEASVGLSTQGVLATSTGEVAEALVETGATVKAGAPAVRTKGTDWRAEFELPRDEAEKVRHLGFCRVEVAGKPFECSLSAEGGDETHVFIDLPPEPDLAAGKSVRLAKARYDAAFVLPASALAPTKGSDRRVYVVKDGRVESYAVVLADQNPSEIVVTQGLEPGSAVVAEVPIALKPRAMVRATPLKP